MDNENPQTEELITLNIPLEEDWEWTESNVKQVWELQKQLDSKNYVMPSDDMTLEVLMVNRKGNQPKYTASVSLKRKDDENTRMSSTIDVQTQMHQIFIFLENLGVVFNIDAKINLTKEKTGYSCMLDLSFISEKSQPQPTLLDEAEEK